MHLLIPFAAPHADVAAQILPGLRLPQLQALLARLTPLALDAADEGSFAPPHERALAQSLHLPVADGLTPWAALAAQRRGLVPAEAPAAGPWAQLTLCHWQTHTSGISLTPPQDLAISAEESQTLLAAMQPYFAEDGIELFAHQPGSWLARGNAFAELRCAALDRVIGRRIDPWMPHGPQAMKLLRLQNEMQMLLYTHPLNDARSERGQRTINSFWISGAGALPTGWTPPSAPPPEMPQSLRDAAVREDWPAWQQAWAALDAGLVSQALQRVQQGQSLTLTLCGERAAQRWEARAQSWLKRLQHRFQATPIPSILNSL